MARSNRGHDARERGERKSEKAVRDLSHKHCSSAQHTIDITNSEHGPTSGKFPKLRGGDADGVIRPGAAVVMEPIDCAKLCKISGG